MYNIYTLPTAFLSSIKYFTFSSFSDDDNSEPIILPRPVYASVKGESDKSVTSRLETSPNSRRTGTHEIHCNVGGPHRLRKSCRLRREVWPIDSSREKRGAEKLHLPRWAHENRGANKSSQVNISKRFQVKISNIYTKPEIIF